MKFQSLVEKNIENYPITLENDLTEDTGTELISAAGTGATVGATLGSVLPGIGTALGTVGGAAVGIVASALSKIITAIKKQKGNKKSNDDILKNPEITKNMEKIEDVIGDEKTDKIADILNKNLDVDLSSIVESLRKEESLLFEIYPNKGESKEDFVSRFMSATKDEYPDVKQRYAVCMSYWERRNRKNSKKESISESVQKKFILPEE